MMRFATSLRDRDWKMSLHQNATITDQFASPEQMLRGLDFLWLELTNRCNLQCIHCYSNSHPGSGKDDSLTKADYDRVIDEAYDLGCRKLQFIGGEPQLNRDLLGLAKKAVQRGYELIEIFSNLTRLNDNLIPFSVDNGIKFATSFYSVDPQIHNSITKSESSHARTLQNIRRLIENKIDLRVGVIAVNQDDRDIALTTDFLRQLGIVQVSVDRVRKFGRGALTDRDECDLADLCGACWSGKLCVSPTGDAHPCIMSRSFRVGNVSNSSLSEILEGDALLAARRKIFDHAFAAVQCVPDCVPRNLRCFPGGTPSPCNPNQCNPMMCNPSCSPVECNPS
jgi:MoaA/NifB/PqqE/SkfB family radical SAM enzyme